MMRARLYEGDGYWEVEDTASGRWWTVAFGDVDLILNENLRSVKPSGALGKKILAAVHAAQEAER